MFVGQDALDLRLDTVEYIFSHRACFEAPLKSKVGIYQYMHAYEWVRDYLSSGADVLDWGCGSGHFSCFLAHLGHRVEGYSIEPDRVHIKPELVKSGFSLTVGDEKEPRLLPYKEASFDMVCSIGVLEHVRETGGSEGASLEEIRRILRPEGLFICYHFPNRWSWIDRVARLIPGKHCHIYKYTKKEIYELCAKHGFEILKIKRYGMLPRNSLHRLPKWLCKSHAFARFIHFLDQVLAKTPILGLFCQNYGFLAKKIDAKTQK